MRALIGMVQALLTPGSCKAAFISAISASSVLPAGHSLGGLRLTTVSLISTGAGSVAVIARPALPNTDATSGNDLMMRSCVCSSSAALVTDRPGSVTGMNSSVPSFRLGMNSLPSCDAGHAVPPRTTAARPREHRHPQHEADQRAIDPDQHPVDRVPASGMMRPRTKNSISTGTSVIDSSAPAGHGEGLGVGQRLEQPALLVLQREHRQERGHDHQQAEEQRRPDLLRRRDQRRAARLARFEALDVLVGVLDHHDGGVHHGAQRDGDAAQAHDVGADAERVHAGERHQHADRQRQDRHQRAAEVQQEDRRTPRRRSGFPRPGCGEACGWRCRSAASGHRPARSTRPPAARLQLLQLRLDVADGGQCVRAVALERDAADHLAGAVHLGDAAPLVGAELDPRHVAQQHRACPSRRDRLSARRCRGRASCAGSRGRGPCTRSRSSRWCGRPRRCCWRGSRRTRDRAGCRTPAASADRRRPGTASRSRRRSRPRPRPSRSPGRSARSSPGCCATRPACAARRARRIRKPSPRRSRPVPARARRPAAGAWRRS